MKTGKSTPPRICSIGIPADDLEIGQFVTVIEAQAPKKTQTIVTSLEDDNCAEEIPELVFDTSHAGVPFEVLAVSWPWGLFAMILPGGERQGPFVQDLRTVRCLRLADEYVNAIIQFKTQNENQQEKELTYD
jgi:hypothetical protein